MMSFILFMKQFTRGNTAEVIPETSSYSVFQQINLIMDMEDLMHDLYIGNFWGMTELFLE
jgi:hypothetical protein